MTPDFLDQATADLRATTVPAGPSADLAAATFAAVTARCHQTQPSRRRIVMRILGYSSLATAAAVVIAIGAVFLGTPRITAAAEFKTAMENAAKAKNLVVLNTQKLTPNSHEMKMKLTVQDSFLRVDILNPGGIEGAPTMKELPVVVTILSNQPSAIINIPKEWPILHRPDKNC